METRENDDLFEIIESREIIVDESCKQGACNGK